MKYTLLFSFLLATLFSCEKEEVYSTTYPQTWQMIESLTKPLLSGWHNTVQPGMDQSWREQCVFQADSTFTKTRHLNGQRETANGTFSVRTSTSGNGKYILLTYKTANPLIGSCTSRQLREYLYFTPKKTLANTDWQGCDGPLVEYKQVPQ